MKRVKRFFLAGLSATLFVCGGAILASCAISDQNESSATTSDENTSNTLTTDEEGTEGLAYYPLNDGTYAVGVGSAIYLSDIVIPATHNGKTVTGISVDGFKSSRMETIAIPDTISFIDEDAFYGCENLTGVYINDITAWCNISFSSYHSNPLIYVGNLYLNGSLLTELAIPNGVTSIGDYTFAWCSNLTSVQIPNSVTSIGEEAFRNCSSLTSVTIPNGVASIGSSSFSDCSSLTNVEISSSVTNIGKWAFKNCRSLTNVTIPNSVTNIGKWAFENCSSLTNVTIGNGVTSIEEGAFYNCSTLTSVYYAGTVEEWSAISIGEDNECLTNATRYYYGESEQNAEYALITYYYSLDAAKDVPVYLNLYSDGTAEISFDNYYNGGGANTKVADGSWTKDENGNIKTVILNDIPAEVDNTAGTITVYFGVNVNGLYIVETSNATYSLLFHYADEKEEHSHEDYFDWVWSENAEYGYDAVLIVTCSQCDFEEEIETDVIREVWVSTCEEDGEIVYTAVAIFDGMEVSDEKTIVVEQPLGHNYGWWNIAKDVAVLTCANNTMDSCVIMVALPYSDEYEDSDWNVQTVPATHTMNGEEVYTYLGEYADKATNMLTYEILLPATGHEYQYAWNWVEDIENGYTATLTVTCECEDYETMTIETTVYKEESPATCEEDGKIVYTAVAYFEVWEWPNKKTVVIEKLGHDYQNGTCTRCGKLDPEYYTEGLVFSLNSARTEYSVTGYGGSSKKIFIPAEYNGLPVTSITSASDYRSGVFYNKSITSIIIGNNIQTIGDYAFAYCSGLTSVTIANNVTSIGVGAFGCCSSLTSVTIPDSVTSIGSSAFEKCSSLANVTIPDSVTSIGIGAFIDCSSLTSVEIPNSVTSIGDYAFYDCSNLTSVTIPNSVTSIGRYAFYGCSSLTNVTIPDSVTSIGSRAFADCSNLINVTIGNSVTSIGSYAFYRCSKLTRVIFENTSGWWYSFDESATSGPSIASEDLANSATAAKYLTSTYRDYYWKRK